MRWIGAGGHARNGTLLRSAPARSGRDAPALAVDSRPHVYRIIGSDHRRGALPALATAFRRLYAPSMCNTRGLSGRLLTAISIA
jgi:hypothetical protein